MKARTAEFAGSPGESSTRGKIRTIAYWIATILGPANFA
jgi:hypothetical protein